MFFKLKWGAKKKEWKLLGNSNWTEKRQRQRRQRKQRWFSFRWKKIEKKQNETKPPSATFVFCTFLHVPSIHSMFIRGASHYLRITFYICINIFCKLIRMHLYASLTYTRTYSHRMNRALKRIFKKNKTKKRATVIVAI